MSSSPIPHLVVIRPHPSLSGDGFAPETCVPRFHCRSISHSRVLLHLQRSRTNVLIRINTRNIKRSDKASSGELFINRAKGGTQSWARPPRGKRHPLETYRRCVPTVGFGGGRVGGSGAQIIVCPREKRWRFVRGWLSKITRAVGRRAPARPEAGTNIRTNQLGRH